MKTNTVPQLRCAIYTRVSTDHGLEQEFNSLDNQREAAEAYIKSQAHEGWRCLPAHYDDGGFSGGSLERPALQKLLADIRARQVDIVVVYKVDRLTRSLADFAKLVELFDEHGVSFVSVTQAFNTTSSMGRLTLNVLLSFAQFEREVTGERIRDKIAASKKKGLWMGGVVPLGYVVQERTLVPHAEHADLVRTIYAAYLTCGSAHALKAQLDREGVVLPERIDGAGRRTGGGSFSRGHLYKLLSNPVYIGEIVHKGQRYPGQHEAILDRSTWDAVQEHLATQAQTIRRGRRASDALLAGRVFDDRGNPMSPSYAQKGSIRYRYYVSQSLLQGRQAEAGSQPRVPAPELERLVIEQLRKAVGQQCPESGLPDGNECALADDDRQLIGRFIEKVTVAKGRVIICLQQNERLRDSKETVEIAWSAPSGVRRREIITAAQAPARPIRAEARAKLLAAIATARRWLDEIVSGKVTSLQAIAHREDCSERSVRMTISLAFLSPVIVQTAVDGSLPRGAGISALADLPIAWTEQWKLC